jgi:hypothetical protein
MVEAQHPIEAKRVGTADYDIRMLTQYRDKISFNMIITVYLA